MRLKQLENEVDGREQDSAPTTASTSSHDGVVGLCCSESCRIRTEARSNSIRDPVVGCRVSLFASRKVVEMLRRQCEAQVLSARAVVADEVGLPAGLNDTRIIWQGRGKSLHSAPQSPTRLACRLQAFR